MPTALDELISRLDRLSAEFEELREGVHKAVEVAPVDPEMALIRARKVLECVVRDVFVRRVQEPPGTRPLENLIQRLVKDGHWPLRLEAFTEKIRKLGNVGAHSFGERVTVADVYRSLTDLMPILEWYFENERPEAGLTLDLPAEVPTPKPEPAPKPNGQASDAPVVVVPKGLRSFDAHDSNFFLRLLPGPRDEAGLPESLRFWKYRIEATEELSFTVGVIYGPSGCGKSSLVKAGLLPRLARRVVSVPVEATPEETEARLLNALRRKFPDLPADSDLAQAIIALRQGSGPKPGGKTLLVLDQFEQWLHAHRHEQDTELARALRQCDGEHVQCLLLVRDDFLVAVIRFLGSLGLDFLQGQNAALVDLFDPIHARTVLAEFGRSYGRLPRAPEPLSRAQESFLDAAVAELSQDGRVIPIHLALFAEMLKGKPWTPASLKQLGGIQGVGVAFLDETFHSAALRSHKKAAQAVLKALLPETGTDIKGQMRSYEELLEALGYAAQPRAFDDLLRILEKDARLITPTDPEGRDSGGADRPAPGGRYYQLTHDYLVPSLREWLTRQQKATRRGRAELRLADRAALWNARPENRHLPSAWEWCRIRLLTRKKDWTEPQRRMMRCGGRVHGVRGLVALVLLVAGTMTGLAVRHRVIKDQQATQAAGLVQRLLDADLAQAPTIVAAMRDHRRRVEPALRRTFREASDDSPAKLRASLALLPDEAAIDYVAKRMLKAPPAELTVLRNALKEHSTRPVPDLWSVLGSAKPDDPRVLPAAGALALYDPRSPEWTRLGGKVAQALVAVNPIYLGDWLKLLRDVSDRLKAPLAAIYRDPSRPEAERAQATNILADYASDDPDLLADLLLDSEERPFALLLEKLKLHPERAAQRLEAELAKKVPSEARGDKKDQWDRRRARAAIALVRLGRPEQAWSWLRHSQDPSVRSYIVNWLKPLGADPKGLMTRMEGLADGPVVIPKGMDKILFHPETSERRALILALGEYEPADLAPGDREALVASLLETYRTHPDAGIHGAAEWTLRRWHQEKKLAEADLELKKLGDRGERRWIVNGEGQTLVIVEGPVVFQMGSIKDTDPDRESIETPHAERIPRRFAIAAKEVTVEQYQRFAKENSEHSFSGYEKFSPDPHGHGPQDGASWYDAAAYCNWLSQLERLDKSQWCYEPNSKDEYAEGMKVHPDFLKRTGYRLPTEAEWEYACRAGSITSRFYGRSIELLGQYAWFNQNSREHAWPCGQTKPNDLGLFDMLGNVYEWCLDPYRGAHSDADGDDDGNDIIKFSCIEEKPLRLFRGGAFANLPAYVRSANRNWSLPSGRNIFYGFRPARTYP